MHIQVNIFTSLPPLLFILFYRLTQKKTIDIPRRRYRTIGHRTERDRRCLSMVDTNSNTINAGSATAARKSTAAFVGSRPVAPWMQSDSSVPATPVQSKPDVLRRYSAATIRSERAPTFVAEDLPASPAILLDEKKSKMKKSETFYARFVKNVLSPSRRQSKDARFAIQNYKFIYKVFFF